jgi:hypothetical protein
MIQHDMRDAQPTEAADWRKPIDATWALAKALRHPYTTLFDSMVEIALRSAEVPVRGCRHSSIVPEIIPPEARRDAEVRVSAASLAAPYKFGQRERRWEDIECNVTAMVPFVRANLLPNWFQSISPPSEAIERKAPPRLPRGPSRGSSSYADADRKLFGRITKKLKAGKARGAYGAALKLAEAGKVAGSGTNESKAKRVGSLYLKERGRAHSASD